MNHMKPFHLISVLILTFTFGCESLVTTVSPDKLPQTESKLVIQSFISPQSARINVAVTESAPLFGESIGNNITMIKKALVKISDGTKEAVIPFDSVTNLFTIEKSRFAIEAGKTYTLTVTDGKRNVSATCQVPVKQATVKSYVIDTVYAGNNSQDDSTLTVKMTWQDIPTDINYYQIRAYMELEYSYGEGTSASTFRERRVRSRFNFRWDQTIGRNDLQSDVNLDGAIFSSPIGRFSNFPATELYDFGSGNRYLINPKTKIISITFEVENTDEGYYKYHRSLELSDSENPFTEPALVYSNVTGGLGCFAAYNSGTLVYKPK